MKIAIIASIWISIPPKNFGFGAQEYLAYHLVEGLKRKGHDVTLFASGDSKTSAKLESVIDRQVINLHTRDKLIKDMFELLNLEAAYKKHNQFDIIHNHLLPYGLLFSDLFQTPTLHTLHHKIYPERSNYYLYEKHMNANYISISNSQREVMPGLNYIQTVYNGIDTNYFKYKDRPRGDYLLYMGRMRRYKGIHMAIAVAKKLGLKLKIVSPLPQENQPEYDEVIEYWNEDIKPYLNRNIEHLDLVSGNFKVELYQNAKALIFPAEHMEPFGMTIIEAMSCGTPVIAYANGSIPEIVSDDRTGYLINQGHIDDRAYQTKHAGFPGLLEAVKKLYNLPEKEYQKLREESRKHVEAKFTVQRMVDEYEKVYKKILDRK